MWEKVVFNLISNAFKFTLDGEVSVSVRHCGDGAELYRSVKSLRELVESFNKRSAVFMNEGRRSLMDISQAVTKVDRKLDPRTGR